MHHFSCGSAYWRPSRPSAMELFADLLCPTPPLHTLCPPLSILRAGPYAPRLTCAPHLPDTSYVISPPPSMVRLRRHGARLLACMLCGVILNVVYGSGVYFRGERDGGVVVTFNGEGGMVNMKPCSCHGAYRRCTHTTTPLLHAYLPTTILTFAALPSAWHCKRAAWLTCVVA